MKTVNGDLIELAKKGEFDVIVHGNNCYNDMNKGIAKSIKQNFPGAFKVDNSTIKGDKGKIGTYTFSLEENDQGGDLIVVNAYTQYNFWEKRDLFEYDGFGKILDKLAFEFKGKRFGLPLIGCGLAGGNKARILGMIEQKLVPHADVTIVEFTDPKDKFGAKFDKK